jgi:diguanylate cyclase
MLHTPMKPPAQTTSTFSPEGEWQAILDSTPRDCRQRVAETVQAQSQELAQHFYTSMMAHHRATLFLKHDVVQQRLMGSMQRWLKDVYAEPAMDITALVAQQRHVGEVHARIQLPMHLVARGARLIKHHLFGHLHASGLGAESLRLSMSYAG